MCFAAYAKGNTALLLAIRSLAAAEGVERPLLDAWANLFPHVVRQSDDGVRKSADRAWRWVGEMGEIADTFSAAGLPDGFHRAAAELYGRLEGYKDVAAPPPLAELLRAVRRPDPPG
jgi:hypothetical protein